MLSMCYSCHFHIIHYNFAIILPSVVCFPFFPMYFFFYFIYIIKLIIINQSVWVNKPSASPSCHLIYLYYVHILNVIYLYLLYIFLMTINFHWIEIELKISPTRSTVIDNVAEVGTYAAMGAQRWFWVHIFVGASAHCTIKKWAIPKKKWGFII